MNDTGVQGVEMSEPSEEQATVWQEPQSLRVSLPHAPTDGFLQRLVSYANHYHVSISITLNVAGATVSGTLISVGDYFDRFANNFNDAFKSNPDLAKNLHDDILTMKPKSLQPEDRETRPPAQYIHLSDARVYSAGQPKACLKTPLWRGRIAEVSGFFLGTPVE